MSTSRTLHVISDKTFSTKDKFLRNIDVTLGSSKSGTFFEFTNLTDATEIYNYLVKQKYDVHEVNYALFFTSPETYTENEFTEIMKSIHETPEDLNITKIKIFKNGNCGKVTVDRLSDYKFFKNFTYDDDLKFYHFKKHNKRRNRRSSDDSSNGDAIL